MSYAAALAALTGSTATLVAAGPPAGRDLRGADADRVLGARDVVVGELRALTGELLGVREDAADRLRPRHLVSDPAHVLHDALRGLGRAVPNVGPPSEVLAASTGPWAEAARAAVRLEGHHDVVGRLPGPAAWAALRDLAELAAAVPYLDADLAGRLAGNEPAGSLLTDPLSHGLVRLCTDGLRGRLPVPDAGYLAALDSEPARGMILRSPADLPTGMRQLAAVLNDLGPQLAAVDARAAVRVLAAGAAAVHRRPPGPAATSPQVRAALAAALPALHRALAEPLATLSPPDPRLRLLTGELHRHTRALADPKTSHAVALGWAREAPATAAALSAAVHAAGASGRLLTSRSKEGVITAAAWRVITPDTARTYPAVAALRQAHDVLVRAAPAIAAAAASAGAAPSRDRALAAAAASAGQAGAQLRVALAARNPHQLPPAPELPPHPSQRQPAAEPPRTSRA